MALIDLPATTQEVLDAIETAIEAAQNDFVWFDTVAALTADATLTYVEGNSLSVAVGDRLHVRDGAHVYEVQASTATDNHLATAGGVKVKLLPGANGYYYATGLGAIADGSDNFDNAYHGYNRDSGDALDSWKWLTGKSYVVGDVVFNTSDDTGYVCVEDHTAGTFGTDASKWEAGAFSGTDNSAAMDLCITHFLEQGLKVYWPAGVYRFADPGYASVGSGNAKHNLSGCKNITIRGERDATIFLMDEAADRIANGAATSYFLDTRQAASPYDRKDHEKCYINDITFVGRWMHAPGGDSGDNNGMGYCPIRVEGFRRNDQSGCRFYFLRNKGTRNAHNGFGNHSYVYGECCARGVLREVNSNHVVFQNCHAKHTDDDPFDANVTDEVSANAMHSTQMLGITVEDCESIICNNGHSVTIQGVTSIRSKGGIAAISRAGSASPASGRAPKNGVIVRDIVAFDPLERYDFGASALTTNDITSGAITIAGNKREGEDWAISTVYAAGAVVRSVTDGQWYTTVAGGTSAGDDTNLSGGSDTGVTWASAPEYTWPGDWDATAQEIRAPWDVQDGVDHVSYMWNPRGASEVQAHGLGLHVSNIQIFRSTKVLANYSDFGFGYMFTRQGFVNPSVSDTNRKGCGVVVQFDLADALFENIYVLGHYAAMSFTASNSNRPADAFRNITLRGIRCHGQDTNGLYFEDPGQVVHWNFTIEDCDFDIDKFFRSARRDTTNNDGSWNSVGGSVYTSIAIACPSNIRGFTVRNNAFRNCLKPFYNGTGSAYSNHHFHNNIVYCEPNASGGYDGANKGIGYLPPAGPDWRYVIEGSDPSDHTTYGHILNECLLSSDAMPTSGWYPVGHIVHDNAPAVATLTATGGVVRTGWARLTDGSTHVLGTDWVDI